MAAEVVVAVGEGVDQRVELLEAQGQGVDGVERVGAPACGQKRVGEETLGQHAQGKNHAPGSQQGCYLLSAAGVLFLHRLLMTANIEQSTLFRLCGAAGSIPVVVRLVRPFDRNAEIVGLVPAQGR